MNLTDVCDLTGAVQYLSENLGWDIDMRDVEDIEDIAYGFGPDELGLKEDAFAKIHSLHQLPPLVDGQKWGVFLLELDSGRFEVSAIRKILSALVPKRRSSAQHATWDQKDLLFICMWGRGPQRTLGIAHFEDREDGLPTIRMISLAPASEDITQRNAFEERLSRLGWPRDTSDTDAWRREWSGAFTTGYRQVIRDAATLTSQLAAQARDIKSHILSILDVETAAGYVHGLYARMRQNLVHDLDGSQFADMYAQTIVYGLFCARCMHVKQDSFNAGNAIGSIPDTSPFLRDMLKDCLQAGTESGLSFDELDVGRVVELLREAEIQAILADFNRQTGWGTEDPVLHFYEQFLQEYDNNVRRERGVFYTPQPVVNFIVRAVDDILRRDFGQEDGLGSTQERKITVMRPSKRRKDGFDHEVQQVVSVPAVQVLDPATGTGTFLRQIVLQIYENFQQTHVDESEACRKDAWNHYVTTHLIPRLSGFELMMAPYAVAHLKLAMVLKDTGYSFENAPRLKIYLTNALEEPGNSKEQMSLFTDPLARESVEANQVKKNKGINVVLGNPPYKAESANRGKWITGLIREYRKEADGSPLHERNPKALNDDYVKFMRLGQQYVEQAGSGIVAFICPHGLMENAVFRGMRAELAHFFDDIYALDLHGNSRKHETAPDGSPDANVFEIQLGVCVMIMVRKPRQKRAEGAMAAIHHAELYGSREHKYTELNRMRIGSLAWEDAKCDPPYCMFKPMQTASADLDAYSVRDLFRACESGFTSSHNHFAVARTRLEIVERIRDMRDEALCDADLRVKYRLKDKDHWKLEKARRQLRNKNIEDIERHLTRCMYKPFDIRWCVLDDTFMNRPRQTGLQLLHADNCALDVGRQGQHAADNNTEWSNALVTAFPTNIDFVRRGGCVVAPLYVYGNGIDPDSRTPNLSTDIVQQFERRTGLRYTPEKEDCADTFAPIDILDYTYAVLYSHKYRKRFKDELAVDFPKVPYPRNSEYFWRMATLGSKLRALHMLEDRKSIAKDISFSGPAGAQVEQYILCEGRILINAKDGFEKAGAPLEASVWDYMCGGYAPLQQWLKERKNTGISRDEIDHYRAMIGAVARTLAVMAEIDKVIEL